MFGAPIALSIVGMGDQVMTIAGVLAGLVIVCLLLSMLETPPSVGR